MLIHTLLYAKGVHMKYIYSLAILVLSGCSSRSLKDQLTDTALEEGVFS